MTAHSSGTTQLIAITASGTQSYLIKVAAAAIPATRPKATTPLARYDGRYSSSGARVENTIDVVSNAGAGPDARRSELHVLHIHELHAEGDVPRDAIASIPSIATAESLSVPSLVLRKETASPARAAPSVPLHGAFRVQAGAFRLPENAAAARQQIENIGGHAEIRRSGSLDLVTLGPLASRQSAEAEATRLKEAGIDAFVVAANAHPPERSAVSGGPHVVQAGAFSRDRNARQLVGRLKRIGEQPFTVTTGRLTFVYVGPFATRYDAVAARERLHQARLDGFVTRR